MPADAIAIKRGSLNQGRITSKSHCAGLASTLQLRSMARTSRECFPAGKSLKSNVLASVKGIHSWLAGWKRKGWRKADGQPVLNLELWQALDIQLRTHRVDAHWVRGHAGHPENERVDRLASAAAKSIA